MVMTLAVAVRSITAGKKLAAPASEDAGVRYGSDRVSLRPAEPRSGGRRPAKRRKVGTLCEGARRRLTDLPLSKMRFSVTLPAQSALFREGETSKGRTGMSSEHPSVSHQAISKF